MKNFIYQTTTKSGKTISFRYPTIDDAEILKDYINKISAEQSFIFLQGRQQTLEAETEWLKNNLEKINKKELVYLCVFDKNDLVGCGEISLGSDARSHVGDFGISIAFTHRGYGLGEKLMDLVIKESIEKLKGLEIITLECFGENKIAQNLYKKMGFIKYGCLPKSLERKGKMDDTILMYKKV